MQSLISSTQRKVIVGLGATGLSVARFLAARGDDFCVYDTRDNPPGLDKLRRELPDVPVLTGSAPQDVLDTAGELIVSPGIAPQEPWLVQAVQAGANLRGDIDLFMEQAAAPVIGITGSNAKSTVTALVGEMARAAGKKAAVGGNLGTPALELLSDEVELYVLELSSFQLERAGDLGLAVATVLNVTPDHLDRHGSMPKYHQAKHRIFSACKAVVYNADDPLTIPPLAGDRNLVSWRPREPELHGFGLREVDGQTYLARGFTALMPVRDLSLAGNHNTANALAALAIGQAAGLPEDAMIEALRAFSGLRHRCELIADKRGVRWINDSKATNVAAAQAAIAGLGTDKNLILIAGGRDKGSDFSGLRDGINAYCEYVLLIGEAAAKITAAVDGASKIETAETLSRAIARAAELAKPGHTVLLSPACASFDQFASYEARGDAFRAEVLTHVGEGSH